MSINNLTEVQGFSISGLQNITADTINGNTVLTTITIAGQTAFLSYDSTTSTLTLLIPTSNGVVSVGLLSATDWNTFNNKENTLTFTSPLTRGGSGGNTISFDFSTVNFWTGVNHFNNAVFMTGYLNHTGDGVKLSIGDFVGADFSITDNITGNDIVKVENDGTKIEIFNYLRTGGKFKIINALTGIDFMELDFDLARTLFNTNMLFRGASTTCENTFIVENRINSIDPMKIHRDILSFPNEYLYFNNTGSLGFNPSAWSINRFGQFNGSSIVVNDFIQATNNIQTTNGFLGGLGLDIQSILNAIANYLNIFGETYLNGNGLYFRNQGDKNHGIQYNSAFDCPRIFGYSAGAEFGRQQSGTYIRCAVIGNSTRPMEIFRDYLNAPSDSWEFLNDGQFRYTPPSGGGWTLSSSGMIIAGGSITIINTTQRNQLNFTEFGVTPSINQWISTTHGLNSTSNGLDGDKIVIGNIYNVNPSYGATIGAHNSALNAWRTLYVNLGGTTIMPTLIVSVSFTPPSDRRLKDEIRYLDSGKSIDFIKRLKPCIYKRVDRRNIPNFIEPEPKLQHGFIADEIEEIAVTEAQRNLVDTFEFNGYKDCRKLAILNLIPEIVQANKEMIDKIERLEQENKLLLERINAMTNVEERLLKIENLIAKKKCLAFI
jgi:hypothetical protein